MISAREFRKEDVARLKTRKWCYAQDPDINYRTLAVSEAPNSRIVSLTNYEEVISILGGSIVWPGVMYAWALISEDVKKVPLSFHKAVKSVIEVYAGKEELYRMQLDVKSDYSSGCKWVESLGFKKEGLMRKYGPDGSDYNLYARIF